jgi:uncharacterized protein (DUF302 family)
MRMRILALFLSAAWLAVPHAAEAEILRIQASQKVPQVVAKLVKNAKARGLRIFATIDHAAGARKAGMNLRPMVLVVFGNPKIGTPLLKASATMGLELPIRVLVWQDKQGRVWVGYTPASFMARRRGVPKDHPLIKRIAKVLGVLTANAAR